MAKLVILFMVALSVAACGRKAPLDTPYQAKLDAREDAQKQGLTVPPEPTPPVKDKPFVLDGLID